MIHSGVAGFRPTVATREDIDMTKAEAAVVHAIRNALTSTSDVTGLRAGSGCDRLVEAILANLREPQVIQALRDLAAASAAGRDRSLT
jgi:hypothetical protein